ncbi:MAG: aminotransferase class V-fold PLP-dependent enzyme [Phycisphaerales bacterium]
MPNSARPFPHPLPQPDPIIDQFVIDPDVVYLNHGSFGACPRAILDAQSAHRLSAERELVRFYVHDCWAKLDRSRIALADLVKCDSADLVFVHNATTGVATALSNLDLQQDDELLVTNCEYKACMNNFGRVADRAGASITVADLPWPISSKEQVIDAIMSKVTTNTKVALLSLITSSTGIRLPVEELIPLLKEQGVITILDAAHGPGCVPMDIRGWGAAYTAGNAHKWLCAPKGAAFLHVQPEHQPGFVPLIDSNDAMDLDAAGSRTGRSGFNHAFDYAGTDDVSAYLTIADCIEWINSNFRGGIQELMNRNKDLCLQARDLICDAIGVDAPVPDSMIGPLSTIDLPAGLPSAPELKELLESKYQIQVPVWGTPTSDSSLRISVQMYNSIEQYEYLAESLKEVLGS